MKEFALLMMAIAVPLFIAAQMLNTRLPARVDVNRTQQQAAEDACYIREI